MFKDIDKVSIFIYIVTIALSALFIGLCYHFKLKLNNELENEDTNAKIIRKYKALFILFFILALLPYTLVSGLRYEVGTDYNYTYKPNFIDIFTKEYTYDEYPFIWLNMLLRLMTDDPTILFLIMAFLFAFFMQISVMKISKNWMMSTALVALSNFFFVSMSNSRQLVAIAILIYAFTFVVDKKLIKFLLLVFFASCFHLSAFIFLIIYPLINFKSKYVHKYWGYAFLGLVVLIPLVTAVAEFVISFTKYAYYFEPEWYSNNSGIVHYLIVSLIIGLYCIFYYKKLVERYGNLAIGLIFVCFISVYIALLSFFIKIPEMMTRLYLTFGWSGIFLTPMIFSVEEDKNMKIVHTFILFGVLTFATYGLIVMKGHHELFPYKWIFNKGGTYLW